MDDDDASLARTDSMSQSQRGQRHRRMESVETRSSMDLPPDALLQVEVVQPCQSWRTKKRNKHALSTLAPIIKVTGIKEQGEGTQELSTRSDLDRQLAKW